MAEPIKPRDVDIKTILDGSTLAMLFSHFLAKLHDVTFGRRSYHVRIVSFCLQVLEQRLPESGDMNDNLENHLLGCRVVEVPAEMEGTDIQKKTRRNPKKSKTSTKTKVKVRNAYFKCSTVKPINWNFKATKLSVQDPGGLHQG